MKAFSSPQFDQLTEAFMAEARTARRAGVGGAELSAALGYVLQSLIASLPDPKERAFAARMIRQRFTTDEIDKFHARMLRDIGEQG